MGLQGWEMLIKYPGRATVSLIDSVQLAAAAGGVKPDTVIEEALQLWLQQRP